MRRRPAYFRMLWAIIFSYAVIIGFGSGGAAGPARLGLLTYLLWTSARLHSDRRLRRLAVVAGAACLIAAAIAAIVGSPQVVSGVVGVCSVVLSGISIGVTTSALIGRWRVDTVTVLGVLCIYLLFALLFASFHEFFASFVPNYLSGVGNEPTASDLLYFSVITLTTVGFGDITPTAEIARAVTVVEALTGQLYLVSVVAGVIGGWARGAASKESG